MVLIVVRGTCVSDQRGKIYSILCVVCSAACSTTPLIQKQGAGLALAFVTPSNQKKMFSPSWPRTAQYMASSGLRLV